MQEKIGVITYHSAYNYGSVLQAYAMQQTIRNLGHESTIINYRMKSQKEYYSLYRVNEGLKILGLDILQLPVHRERVRRSDRFEKFIQSNLNLSVEITEPEEVLEEMNKYSVLISGSDQIWNKHSNELENQEWRYMMPYLLKNAEGKKISYASSITNMTDEDLDYILPYLRKFYALAMREKSSTIRLEKLLNKKITHVVDPTFLLNREEWINCLNIKESNKEEYIFYYSLDSGFHKGYQYGKSMETILSRLADKYNCKIYVVTPFLMLRHTDSRIINLPDLGPLEFITYICNASKVITNSYHGTILSVNFRKDFFSLCDVGPSDMRKKDILESIGLTERILLNKDDLLSDLEKINYDNVGKKIAIMRKQSYEYLNEMINR